MPSVPTADMADKQYAPPSSPPPNYNQPKPTTHQDAGPYPPQPVGSPAPHEWNQMNMYNNESGMRAPDPTYGGYYNNGPQGQYGPPPGGYYAPGGQNQGGFYGAPQPQGMYYQQQGPGPMYGQPQPGYYYDDRRGGSGSGICAGIMAAMACCCCMDILF